ncbi:hypothetical protein [Candidatus Protochlamydia sp. R18]|uniref:hypothetical protein n=1 Tax=Candidatus Protochlamydia sp. R18 TaxID=1353977 RepID=UPI0005A6BCD6|nr:hypothetical protein [Candidatus Protochlamydia sp. R18]
MRFFCLMTHISYHADQIVQKGTKKELFLNLSHLRERRQQTKYLQIDEKFEKQQLLQRLKIE